MKKYIPRWCVLALTLLGVSTGFVSCKKSKQQEFIDHWNQVRTAVVKKNFKEFSKLTESPNKKAAKMTQEGFEELVDFIYIYSFPEWQKVKLVKFEQNDKAAILVLRLRLDREEIITIAAYKFFLRESGWKLLTDFYEYSASSSDTKTGKDTQKIIEKVLNEKANFQLN